MADEHPHGDIIIIKKKSGGDHAHHGGAWKIAFADFMTAMMAFFLVLWIINASDKETKTVIARYFNPIRLENPAKAKKGVHGDLSAPTQGKEEEANNSAAPPVKIKESKGAPVARESDETKNSAEARTATAAAKIQAAETQLFAAPYETLDRIAGAEGDLAPGASPDKGDADPQRLAGALSIDSFRDPFKPIGPSSPDESAAFDSDSRAKAPPDLEPGKTGPKDQLKPQSIATGAETPQAKLTPADADKPALTRAGEPAQDGKSSEAPKGDDEAGKLEKQLKQEVDAALKNGGGPAVEIKRTKDGLLISLTDKLDFSMFAVGSAEPRRELVRAMDAIARIVKATPGHIIVRGYTDARPYRNGAYDNWRLSSDRAQMAYYMLTRGGVPAARFVRVEGYADRALKDSAHPLAAVNRRLEILIQEGKT